MSRLRDFFRGTLVCVIEDTSPERFMNLCRSRRIYLTQIHSLNGKIEFEIGLKDYWHLRPVVKKCHIVPHITKKKGLPFILNRNKRHKFFFLGMVLAVLILFILSQFIWNIEIEGNYSHTDENLIAFMKDIDVYTGQWKHKIDVSALEEELRLEFDDISWVSARMEGTVLKLEVKEGKVLTPDTEGNVSGNVVAAQNGKITSIVTRTGTPKVNIGDTVSAGDILIEGIVNIYNDDGTVKDIKRVHGDGDIYADIVYHCEDYYPAYYIRKVYSGNNKISVGLELFGHMFTVGNENFENKNYEKTSQVTKYRLTPNFYLPFRLYTVKSRMYEKEKVKYSNEEMKVLGEKAIQSMLEQFIEKGAVINDDSLVVNVYDDYYVILGDVYMTIPIGEFQPHNSIDDNIG